MKRHILLMPLLLAPTTALALQKPLLADPLPFPNMFDPTQWTPPNPGDGGGGGLPDLYASGVAIASRTHDAVTLTWHNSSSALAGLALQSSDSPDGSFATVQCWQPMAMSMYFSKSGVASTGDCINAAHPGEYTHSGLALDTLHCYRIRAWDDQGGEAFSTATCAYTRAHSGTNEDPLQDAWQARLMIETGTASGAGTDDHVRVGLNDHRVMMQPHGNATWLDYPHDDFERDSAFTYSLNLGSLDDVNDITELSLYKEGNDDWCVSRTLLAVNRDVIAEQDFTSLPGGRLWLTSKEPLVELSHEQLRAAPQWSEFVGFGPGTGIDNLELVNMIEGAVGHIAYSTELYWNGDDDGAIIEGVDADTLHVDIQASASVDHWFDPTVRIEFDADVVVTCVPDPTEGDFEVSLEVFVTDPQIAAEGWTSELGEFLVCTFEGDWNCLEEELADRLGSQLPSFPSGTIELGFCPDVQVDEFGSIVISLPS